MRTKFVLVQPKSHDVRTIHAPSPAAASARELRAAVHRLRVRRVGLDVRLALRPVEDVVRRVRDERQAELGRVLCAADVDRRGALRILLRAVDVRPRRGVKHETDVAGTAGGGSVTSHSARVSATTPSAENSSCNATPSWPAAPVTRTPVNASRIRPPARAP